MIGSSDIRRRVFISYGAMKSVFKFLKPRKVLSLQAMNKFMYHRGVERLQKSIPAENFTFFFIYPETFSKKRQKVYVYDNIRQDTLNPILLAKDLSNSMDIQMMIQCKESIILFGNDGVNLNDAIDVTRIDLSDQRNPKLTMLPSLIRTRCWPSFAKYKNKRVYLIGGPDEAARKVDIFNLISWKWFEGPPLREGRLKPAAICLGKSVYVFGG